MIERYCTDQMKMIWSEENKFRLWVLIEKIVNKYLQIYNIIPKNKLFEKLEKINIKKLIKNSKKEEQETKHDLNAFVFACEKMCGKNGKWIHYGLTSSDVLDTTAALQIKESKEIIEDELLILYNSLDKRLRDYSHFICGRTHGQAAEIIRVSEIFKLFQQEIYNNFKRLKRVKYVGKISGTVGDNKFISQTMESVILSELGVYKEKTNQIVQRENYAELIFCLALIAATLEKMALQIRLYQQSGIEEMFEPFQIDQTGSSAMPHKKNPVLCENICSLSRLIRSYINPCLENVSLWGQRDMTHSAVERVILPDAFNILHFMIKRMQYVLNNLYLDYNRMDKNIDLFLKNNNSQEQMLKLIREGKSRKEAYKIVQNKIK